MRLAVVTPYCNESRSLLEKCYNSVRSQTLPVRQIFVSDGTPAPYIDEWDVDHLILDDPHKDGGGFARGLGGLQAVAHGFDAIMFLDADNWYKPDHAETMVRTQQKYQCPVVAGVRELYTLDGQFLHAPNPVAPDFHIDTNCLFLMPDTFCLLPLWMHDARLNALYREDQKDESVTEDRQWLPASLINDHVFTYALKTFNLKAVLADHPTVCYRMRYAAYYRSIGVEPPEGSCEEGADKIILWWENLPALTRVTHVVSALPKDRRPKINMVDISSLNHKKAG